MATNKIEIVPSYKRTLALLNFLEEHEETKHLDQDYVLNLIGWLQTLGVTKFDVEILRGTWNVGMSVGSTKLTGTAPNFLDALVVTAENHESHVRRTAMD